MFSQQDYDLKVLVPHGMGGSSFFFSTEPSDATLHICYTSGNMPVWSGIPLLLLMPVRLSTSSECFCPFAMTVSSVTIKLGQCLKLLEI